MSSPGQVEIAIIGGGLSGLSLAEALAETAAPPSVLVLEAAPVGSLPDHTWCFWETDDAVPRDRVSQRWPRWQVGAVGKQIRPHCPRHPYARVSARLFLSAALEQIGQAPSIRIWNDARVETLREDGDGVWMETADGRRVNARWVFDSRPPRASPVPWRQIFCGFTVRTREPVFDPEEAVLMDFREAGKGGIRFFYTLPTNHSTALVEDTWLVPAGAPAPSFPPDDARRYVETRWGATLREIAEVERGDLPMGLPAPCVKGRCLPWGSAAGAIRPSSGYALTRIRRASRRMAEHWERTRRPAMPLHHSPWWMRWMDGVFLRVMARHPERMPALFAAMFARTPPESLARFLDSNPRPTDVLRIMRALPTGLFLKHVLVR
ncbi:MAG: FAD/NAD(P)-binding protein [Opitutales bacterium]|nr:FAD/NAD(P)-binding protein [Opitutales bacterium]